jgi:hypothetical protein
MRSSSPGSVPTPRWTTTDNPKGKVAELRAELNTGGKKDKNHAAKKIALKRIVANMTMSNNDMVALFQDVINCMRIPSLEIKKMSVLVSVEIRMLIRQVLFVLGKLRPGQARDGHECLAHPRIGKCSLVEILAHGTGHGRPKSARAGIGAAHHLLR